MSFDATCIIFSMTLFKMDDKIPYFVDGNSDGEEEEEHVTYDTPVKILACAFCDTQHVDLMPCADCGKTHYCSTMCYNEHVELEHGKTCILK